MFARLRRIVGGMRVTDLPRAPEDMCQKEGGTGTRRRREGRGERGEGRRERGEGEREGEGEPEGERERECVYVCHFYRNVSTEESPGNYFL